MCVKTTLETITCWYIKELDYIRRTSRCFLTDKAVSFIYWYDPRLITRSHIILQFADILADNDNTYH